MALYLASHVYTCVSAGQLVLLDLRRDQYHGLSAGAARSIAAHVEGWPALNTLPDRASSSADRTRQLLDRFEGLGVLTRTAPRTRIASKFVEPAKVALVREEPGVRPHATWRDLTRLLIAAGRASWARRSQPLEEIITRVHERKQALASAVSGRSHAPNGLQAQVGAYLYLRPLLMRVRDNCLFDAHTLIEYLAARDAYPTWVFGVRSSPFKAHCWVQEGAFVYNDLPEYVRRFTPILAV